MEGGDERRVGRWREVMRGEWEDWQTNNFQNIPFNLLIP